MAPYDGLVLLLVSMLLGAAPGLGATLDQLDFARDVRPLLEAHCVECHGADKHKAGLRLDRRSDELFGRGHALAPGEPEQSLVYRRITSRDPDERMPNKGEPLAAAEIELVRRWIAEGARWPADPDAAASPPPSHWSYRPIAAPAPPALSDEAWPRQPLDRFVLAELERAGLAPAPRAQPGELLRRAALDLDGIPPTLAELDAFERDPSADAFAAAVDRLLDSPRYAERMAQWWLDLARYADTHGYEKDAPRAIWPWRDWVLDAFARDLPFDEFTIEQLAGDLLPNSTRAQQVATGFHRNTLINEEGGTDDEEFRVAAVVDRANTTAQIWLGTTLGCAQCHSHKYDPFSQREYYQFYAFFDQTEDGGKAMAPTLELPSDEQQRERERLRKELAEAEAARAAAEPAIEADQARWEEQARAALGPEPSWRRLGELSAQSSMHAWMAQQDDGSWKVGGTLPASDRYAFELRPEARVIGALRIEAVPDPELPLGGASRAANANFSLTDAYLEVWRPESEESVWECVRFERADADRRQAGTDSAAGNAIDADVHSGWIVDGPAPAQLVLAPREPLELREDAFWTLKLEFRSPWEHHELGRLRLSFTSDRTLARSLPQGEQGFPWAIREALRIPPEQRSDTQRAAIRDDFRTRVSSAAREQRERVEGLRKQLDALEASIPSTPVLRERAQRRTTHVLGKGSFLTPLDEVQADVPAVLPPLPAGVARDRLALARWLVARENPLSARVIANRIWERLFGRGLVATLDDFGARGDAPTHPELLDHLATRLVELGWSLKRFQRELVLSASYAQSSRVTPELLARDPQNALFARASRPRLEIETLRDQALAISGLLVEKLGGPSVRPPQPEGVEAHVYSDERWIDSTGPDRYRRGLYTFWKRSSPYGTFATFDAPSRELACTRRARTNTPLQALALLNDPAFDECARALGQRLLEDAALGSERDRLAAGFRACTARAPSAAELDRLAQLLAAELGDARELPATERAPRAWSRVAAVLLNLDEVLCRN